jgi:hypothetical protein
MDTVSEFNNILTNVRYKIINHDTLKTQDVAVLEEIVSTLRKLYDILNDILLKRSNNEPETDSLQRLFSHCLQNGVNEDELDQIKHLLHETLIVFPYVIIPPAESSKVSPV